MSPEDRGWVDRSPRPGATLWCWERATDGLDRMEAEVDHERRLVRAAVRGSSVLLGVVWLRLLRLLDLVFLVAVVGALPNPLPAKSGRSPRLSLDRADGDCFCGG